MTALAQVQTPESLLNFESGSHKRKLAVVEPFLTDNIYANKKQKMMNGGQLFQRGRFKFDEIGILRTKPGQ